MNMDMCFVRVKSPKCVRAQHQAAQVSEHKHLHKKEKRKEINKCSNAQHTLLVLSACFFFYFLSVTHCMMSAD